MKEESINTFLQSRVWYVIVVVLGALMAYSAWLRGIYYPYTDAGISSTLFLQGWQNSFTLVCVNYALIVFATIIMILLNKSYLFLGGLTMLFASLYILLECAVPDLSATWNSGSAVAVVTLICMFILFSCYENRASVNRIFLIFTLLSAFSFFQVAFVYLLVLFFVGVVQIRAFSLRTFLAMIFGIVTPYWLAIGFGMWNPLNFVFPVPVPIYMLDVIPFYFVSAAVIAFIGIVAVVANFLTLMKYRLQIRVYNGFALIMLLLSMALMIVDAGNALAYFALLNVGVAMQVAHVFFASTFKRRYIFIVLIFLLMVANYVWAWQV